MTLPNGGRMNGDDIDDEIEMPPPLQQSSTGGLGGKVRAPEGMLKTALVSIVVTFVVIAGMSFAGGVSFVTKKDFTANMAGVTATLDQAKAELAQAQADVAAALQNLPGTVSSQVNNSISQATSTWNSQLSSMSSQIDSLNSEVQSYSSTLNQLTSSVNTNSLAFDDLQGNIDTLVSDIAALTALIADMNDRLDDLESGGSGGSTTVPTITSFTPTSGATNQSVIITGTNFSNVSAVLFGGTAAQSFNVDSATQITAVVAGGSTGSISVVTSQGTAISTSTFTYTGGSQSGGVYTTFSLMSIFTLPNTVYVNITNNSGQDIVGGQFSLTIQYLDATPSPTNMVGLTSTEIVWGTTGSVSGVSLTMVGTASGLFIMDGQTKIVTINITPPVTGTYFKIANITYTGWLQ